MNFILRLPDDDLWNWKPWNIDLNSVYCLIIFQNVGITSKSQSPGGDNIKELSEQTNKRQGNIMELDFNYAVLGFHFPETFAFKGCSA